MRTIGRYMMVLAAGGMLAACSTTQKPVVVTPSAVEGKTWVLSSLDGEPPVDGARVTLEFKPASATEARSTAMGLAMAILVATASRTKLSGLRPWAPP